MCATKSSMNNILEFRDGIIIFNDNDINKRSHTTSSKWRTWSKLILEALYDHVVKHYLQQIAMIMSKFNLPFVTHLKQFASPLDLSYSSQASMVATMNHHIKHASTPFTFDESLKIGIPN